MAAEPEWAFDVAADIFTVQPDVPGTVLGAGSYGAVYRATLRSVPAAAKTLHALQHPILYGLVGPDADPAAAQAVLREFNAEVESLSRVRHPNVLRLLGVGYQDGLPKWIVTERQPHSLHSFVRMTGVREELRLSDAVCLALDVADGLAHLHGLGMVHRDLKPKNVLVGGAGAKVADLGTAKMIGIAAGTAQHSVGPGTAAYHPPEVLEGRYTHAIDVYSLGLTIIEIVLAESPRRDSAGDPVDADQRRRAIAAHGELSLVIDGCIAQHARDRVSSARALEMLEQVAAAPGFADGGVEEAAAGSWADRVQQETVRELIDEVTRRRAHLLLVKPPSAADVQKIIGKSIRLGSVHFRRAARTEYLFVPTAFHHDAQRRYVFSLKQEAKESFLSKSRFLVEAVPGHDDQIRLVSVRFSTAARKEYLCITNKNLGADRRYVCSWKGAANEEVLSQSRFQVESVPGHDDQIRLVSVHFSTATKKEYLYVAAIGPGGARGKRRYIVSSAASDDVLSKARFQVECLE